jgi:hypothetical protein
MERPQKDRSIVEGFKVTALSKQQLMEGLAGAIHLRDITYPAGPSSTSSRSSSTSTAPVASDTPPRLACMTTACARWR